MATERSLFRERLSNPRGCRRSCRRSQDAEDAEERSERAGGDNEIEMAKADHRIGWLNRGWRRRAKQVAQDENEGANPNGYSTVCERVRARARVSCSTKLILNRNIFVELSISVRGNLPVTRTRVITPYPSKGNFAAVLIASVIIN